MFNLKLFKDGTQYTSEHQPEARLHSQHTTRGRFKLLRLAIMALVAPNTRKYLFCNNLGNYLKAQN